MDNVLIKKFTINDLNLIRNKLETDFDDFWNYNILAKELQNEASIYLCCKVDSEIVGFAGISIVLDSAELNNIVIKKDRRGNGYSSLLLKKIINIAKSRGCNTLNLEVASNNKVAIHLYESFGFIQVGIRNKYYNNVLDALLYTLKIA